jgi:hypothetical protein
METDVMTLAVDISNYTGPITSDQVDSWRSAGVGLVIVQAVDPPAAYPAGCTRQQLQMLNQAGMPAEAYVFFWFDSDPTHVDHALSLLEGVQVRRVWLDLEDVAAKNYDQSTTEAKVADALRRCDAWSQAHNLPPAGIYTGSWYWTSADYMGNTQAFKDRDLWDAHYDYVADAVQGFQPYGGWAKCMVKQHIGSSVFCGVPGLDQDCLSAEYAQAVLGAPPRSALQAQTASVSCPPVPQDYQTKFGVGIDGWPAVAANLEGIIHQVMAQVQQVTQLAQADEAKLEQIRALVAAYNAGTLGQIRVLAPA